MANEIVILGILVSLVFSELTGFSPAGLIVPGYLVLALKTPTRLLYTLVIVLLTFLTAKVIASVTILYGRRRFAVMILLSFAIHWAVMRFGLLNNNPGVIGALVPGIMANEWERQGVLPSMLSLAAVMGVLALLLLWGSVPVFG